MDMGTSTREVDNRTTKSFVEAALLWRSSQTIPLRDRWRNIVSPKYSSLAIDDTFREFDNEVALENSYEPDLQVIVNVHYGKTPALTAASSDVVSVKGSITVSF
jgi:hypothetical protein